jgi:hypothetical protein
MQVLLSHLHEELVRAIDIAYLGARLQQGCVCDRVGSRVTVLHEFKGLQGTVNLLRLAARVDQTIKGDHVRLDTNIEHALQHGEGLLDIEGLAARAYERCVRCDRCVAHIVGRGALEHSVKNLQAALKVLSLGARVDNRRERVCIRVDALALH